MIDQHARLQQGRLASQPQLNPSARLPQFRTSFAERSLLFTSIVILPLQDHIPPMAGMSVSFIIFAILALYIIVNRSRILGAIWYHPIFIAAFAFIGVSAILEFTSPLSRYAEILRFGQMIVGAMCVAVLCRDRSALAVALYGYVAAALWVAVVLYLTSYGALSGMKADDFQEAGQVRAQTAAENPLQANLNGMAFTCVQGSLVAFALSLSGRFKHRRTVLLGVAIFCLVASFLPMSRTTTLIALLSFPAILYTHGIKQVKAVIFVCILGMGIYMLVPDAVWSRMTFSTEVQSGKMEGRAWIYTTALNRLPEYIVAGVGAGNFFNRWGFEKGFAKKYGDVTVVIGTHSAPLAVTLYWGALGLLTFLWIIWLVYRSIPTGCGRDELSLALIGILVSFGPWLLQTHNYYEKAFALVLGILVGAGTLIWPTGVVSTAETNRLPAGSDVPLNQSITLARTKR